MKKVFSLILVFCLCFSLCSCSGTADFTVGICQLTDFDSHNKATVGFIEALKEELAKNGKTVKIEQRIVEKAEFCKKSIEDLTALKVDLIMACSTPALLAAADCTVNTPVVGTLVTDYHYAFVNNIPKNVTGTSDAVPFEEQAKMMVESLKLIAGDKVGIIYCSKEANSTIQLSEIKKSFEAYGIVLNAYPFTEISELQTVTATAALENKAVYLPSDNTVAYNEKTIGIICSQNKIPVFTAYGGDICYASLTVDYYALGREAGKMAAEILLNNKTPEEFEILSLSPIAVYNKEICNELGITVP
ncbi:MAG: ABC transporter substrate-binding protein [Clostridia bacterium]|nr:ABC transporter substrate-binding protein [Clostridia bacterium]